MTCAGASSARAAGGDIESLQTPPRALAAPLPSTADNKGTPSAQEPEPRVALVIGNSSYQNAPTLDNPDNDAHAVAQLLNSAGFEVITATDLTQNEMLKVVQDFSSRVAAHGPNAVAMVYYAGHGVQLAGENYLIPIDARISAPSDLATSTVRLVDLMATLEAVPSRMRIVVLDACRNNPFPSVNDAGRGLAIVDAPNGSIVGYSTSPGEEALDGRGEHSPYAQAFLNLAQQPNLPIEQLFKRVRLRVNQTTDGRQTPWESSSLTSDFTFFGNTLVAAARPAENAPVIQMAANLPSRSVRQAYDYVLSENRPQYYREFVEMYPRDPLADRIRALLAGLVQAAAWHETVLANSPAAYKSFSETYADSPYAPVALRLQVQPRAVPMLQPSRLMLPPQMTPVARPLNLGDQLNGRPGLLPKLPANNLPPRQPLPSTVVTSGNPINKGGPQKVLNAAPLGQGNKAGQTVSPSNPASAAKIQRDPLKRISSPRFETRDAERHPGRSGPFKPNITSSRPSLARGPGPMRGPGTPHLAQSGPRGSGGGFGRGGLGFR
ncbi:caspase family protein [Bradyrhizobium ontarionense]|uniref:Caspase family protein n=1 Tax=Bradyrhizobium ontarionense TaxID=2898149 RepID=A0ABY3RPS5_9BRAD|nr:caspase family protein [Bradyrhizobium sp. A19]UFZ08637.1 caspase family protein [Bradyrhizobium sp. A19]